MKRILSNKEPSILEKSSSVYHYFKFFTGIFLLGFFLLLFTSSAMAAPETCTNGVDDGDTDTDIDCADSECFGMTCRNKVPGSPGACDVAEVCPSTAGVCPARNRLPNTFQCGTAGTQLCDANDFCDGVAKTCPDLVKSAGTSCRADIGVCDIQDFCDGTAKNCPDVVEPNTTLCRASTDTCDVAENCDGVNNTCPPDAVEPATTVCRASTDTCDAGENCDGSTKACPTDAVEPNTTVCRASTDTCDAGENCDGTTKACPTDAVEPNTTVCRASTDTCDAGENCDGTTKACPTDAVELNTTVCRASTDTCDAAENCNGTDKTCPTDAVEPDTTVCRPAEEACDVAENCDGTTATCPEDESMCSEGFEACRNVIFWANHAGQINGLPDVALSLIQNADGGCIQVCGETIDDTDLKSASSAEEALCTPLLVLNKRHVLVRELTAAMLNCLASGQDPYCYELITECDEVCMTQSSTINEIKGCITALNDLNNGRSDLALDCNKEPLPGYPTDPRPGSIYKCSLALFTPCTVISPGENLCKAGTNNPD